MRRRTNSVDEIKPYQGLDDEEVVCFKRVRWCRLGDGGKSITEIRQGT